jgi:hypothetical protein
MEWISTFQRAIAGPSADMLGLEPIIRPTSCVKGSEFALAGLTICCFAFTGTATLTAFMSAAVESDTTDSEALGRFLGALMTDCA